MLDIAKFQQTQPSLVELGLGLSLAKMKAIKKGRERKGKEKWERTKKKEKRKQRKRNERNENKQKKGGKRENKLGLSCAKLRSSWG